MATTISLIPLPEIPSAELPLTAFQANQAITAIDPRASEVSGRLRQFANNYKAFWGSGIQPNPLAATQSGVQAKQQYSSANTAPPPFALKNHCPVV